MAKPAAPADTPLLSVAVPPAPKQALLHWASRNLGARPGPNQPVAIALSGGADSVALLLTACAVWPGAVVALHVNHGLQAAADGFAASCRALCQSLGVPLSEIAVQVPLPTGSSLEAEARRERYASLARHAQQAQACAVLLGHHADDQAETVLLALTRGAGIPGLAAMGELSFKHGVAFGRPFLGVRAAALRQWLVSAGVPFVDDPTNQDQRHARNRIRHSVLPQLAEPFPSIVATLARTARHAAEATGLLLDLAREDLLRVGNPPGLKALQALSRARQANVLRHWLQTTAGTAPSTAQLDELLSQVAHCTTRGHTIDIKVVTGKVCRMGDGLQFVAL